jgi:predicted regulator of Ras-like GTPase activity (Roadblock/LC7/MglB family)
MTENETESKTDQNDLFLKKLQEINNKEGIMGYILRREKSASIDLKDPTKIIEYAMLSSEVQEAGNNIKEKLDLGDLENIVLESNDKKLIFKNIDSDQVTIFMEKTTDHNKICKNLK